MALTEIARFTIIGLYSSVGALAQEGSFAYFGLSIGGPNIVVKIDKSTMLEVARWTGLLTDDMTSGIVSDGTFIYVCIDTTSGAGTGALLKIDPTTMLEVDRWASGAA